MDLTNNNLGENEENFRIFIDGLKQKTNLKNMYLDLSYNFIDNN